MLGWPAGGGLEGAAAMRQPPRRSWDGKVALRRTCRWRAACSTAPCARGPVCAAVCAPSGCGAAARRTGHMRVAGPQSALAASACLRARRGGGAGRSARGRRRLEGRAGAPQQPGAHQAPAAPRPEVMSAGAPSQAPFPQAISQPTKPHRTSPPTPATTATAAAAPKTCSRSGRTPARPQRRGPWGRGARDCKGARPARALRRQIAARALAPRPARACTGPAHGAQRIVS
jgi:hypothetical protein